MIYSDLQHHRRSKNGVLLTVSQNLCRQVSFRSDLEKWYYYSRLPHNISTTLSEGSHNAGPSDSRKFAIVTVISIQRVHPLLGLGTRHSDNLCRSAVASRYLVANGCVVDEV